MSMAIELFPVRLEGIVGFLVNNAVLVEQEDMVSVLLVVMIALSLLGADDVMVVVLLSAKGFCSMVGLAAMLSVAAMVVVVDVLISITSCVVIFVVV